MAMDKSEVLDRVLSEHAVLRELLDQLEGHTRGVLQSRSGAAEQLRMSARLLETRLREHLRFEDEVLVSALADSDAWSNERVERLHADHARQREILDLWSEHASADRSMPVFALAAWGLVQLLREDMDDEERVSVNEDVLRDDPTNPYMETD